jgi:TRAP-type mannitol/chloroaromatic compound transport system substrate-binding protein
MQRRERIFFARRCYFRPGEEFTMFLTKKKFIALWQEEKVIVSDAAGAAILL